MKHTKKCAVVAFGLSVGLLTGCSGATASASGEYEPANTVRYLVGFQAGGGTDLTARKTSEQLQAATGSKFAVENLTGGAGTRAMTTLVNQGDDDTLMQLVDAPTSLFLDGVGIEREDIRPVAQMATNALVVVVPGDSEYADVAELMEDVAGDANIGTPGTVESREAAKWTEMAQATGVEGDLNFVTSNGVDAIIPEVISGRQEAVMLVPTVASGFLESGELKALAVTSDERLEAFPDVPTLVESGIDTTFYRPQGVALPATASPEAAEFWEERLEEISEDPEWQGFLEDNGYIPEYKGSDEYTEWIDAEMAEYKQYFDSLGGGEGS